MATIEMVEKLRERANVTYEEAKQAIDACGGDLLEAMIYLERNGKVTSAAGGFYSTKDEQGAAGSAGAGPNGCSREKSRALISRFINWLRGIIHKGNTNYFEVWRGERRVISLPVTVVVVLALCCPWVVLPLVIVGLFMGCVYRFKGTEVDQTPLNSVMDSAARAAEGIKSEIFTPVQVEGHEHDDK